MRREEEEEGRGERWVWRRRWSDNKNPILRIWGKQLLETICPIRSAFEKSV